MGKIRKHVASTLFKLMTICILTCMQCVAMRYDGEEHERPNQKQLQFRPIFNNNNNNGGGFFGGGTVTRTVVRTGKY